MNLFSNDTSLVFISLFSGFIFGFLLRKGTVTRSDVILKQLLLKDFTVMQIILTAILVGSFGIYLSDYLGILPEFHLSVTPILWTIIGGSIFGIGMSLFGYCPGTVIGALGESPKHIFPGIFGMFAGSLLFNQLSGIFIPLISKKDALAEQTLGSYFHLPTAAVILALFFAWSILVWATKKYSEKLTVAKNR